MAAMIERIANDVVTDFCTVDVDDIRQLLRKHMLAITICVYHSVQAGDATRDPIRIVSQALADNDELQADIVRMGTDLSNDQIAAFQPPALISASCSVINAAREQFGDRRLGRIALEELQLVMPVPGFLTAVSA